ncbi:hypothetical protein [Spiroplasma endosymbiont of Agriotes lineatus]|uniref:hypothetical protein n=1 Tax=Spiroplasma endosymbiont of Agriotes lineatus TaxID=3077930 RepID=UPI0030CD412C
MQLFLSSEKDYINILGQNLLIQHLIISCIIIGIVFIAIISAILLVISYRNRNIKNSSWEKFKNEKLIYNIESEIIKMRQALKNK